MQFTPNTSRIGVFYDGNFLLHASNFYNYIHPQKKRLSINGLHKFICHRVAEEEGLDAGRCTIVESHYFRGRLNAAEASQRGNQLYNDRVFDDILMAEGIHTHYLPLRNMFGRREERGTDVWLSLEVFERAILGKMDVAVLVVADTDYAPLFRKLTSLGVRVMLIGWEFEYVNDDGVKMVTKTSHELLNLATYPVAMHEVIECGLQQDNKLIAELFVGGEGRPLSDIGSAEREVSEVLSIKTGYGFIKYPNNNLFFHSLDVVDGDFSDIMPGDTVEFSIDKNESGQEVAKLVKKLESADIEEQAKEDMTEWSKAIFDEDASDE